MTRYLCRAVAVSTVLLATLTGCVDQQRRVLSDIRSQRATRYEAWRAQTAGRDSERPLLQGALSLDESLRIALQNSRPLQEALLQREIASARITAAYAQALPQVDVGATYAHLDKAVGGKGGLDQYAVTGSVTQPIYRGGSVGAGVRAAGIFSLLTDEQVRGTYQAVLFNTQRAYYDVLLAQDLERASAEAVAVSRRLLEDAEKNFRAGTFSAFDVLRAQVELKTNVAANVQDQNRVHLAVTRLLNVLGISQESAVQLSDALAFAPLSPVLDEAVETAFQRQSEILQSELTVRLQREAVVVAKSGYYPAADLFFRDSFANPNPHTLNAGNWGNAWSAGVAVTYRLFEGFRTEANVREAKAALAQSQVALRDTEERILLAIKQAMFSLDDASRAVQAQQANRDQAREALRLAELGYREGVRRQVEVLDAQRALTTAQAAYAQAVYSHQIARLQFGQATGTLEPPDRGYLPAAIRNTPGSEPPKSAAEPIIPAEAPPAAN